MTCGTYMIRNKKTGQIYIGQSKDIEKRFRTHCYISDIDKAILLEGKDNFVFSIIEEVDESLLREREKYWIDYYNVEQDIKHYNRPPITPKGCNGLNRKYVLWDTIYCYYNRHDMIRNNRVPNPCKCFAFHYKGKKINIGFFHDFITCKIINQLVKEAIK